MGRHPDGLTAFHTREPDEFNTDTGGNVKRAFSP